MEGDSVPIRDFRAADRGVILPLTLWVDGPFVGLVGGASASEGTSRLDGSAGDALCVFTSLGVK